MGYEFLDDLKNNSKTFKEFYLKQKSLNVDYSKIKSLKFISDKYTYSEISELHYSWYFYNNIQNIVKCKYCNSPAKLLGPKEISLIKNLIHNDICCSTSCILKKRIDYNLKEYGVDNISKSDYIKQKISNSNKLKQSNVETNNKRKKTNLIKFGVEFASQNSECKNKAIETNLSKYGVEHHSKSKIVKSKTISTNIKRHGVEYSSQGKQWKDAINKSFRAKIINDFESLGYMVDSIENTEVTILCKKCNKKSTNSYGFLYQRKYFGQDLCTHCNPYKTYSQTEKNLYDLIVLSNIDVFSSNREILNGKEIDIYIPSLKIGFEFNGVYWHSEKFKSKYYHQEKKFHAIEQGVNLIHIWEDDWEYKRPIIEARIKNVLGVTENKIFARKCSIVEVSSSDSKTFLEQNHIQGQIGAKHRLGLKYEGNLVSLMTFGIRNGKMEMLRFCNKLGYNVVGGFSKLLKHFRKEFTGEIYSYADLDWSNPNDNVYISNGFRFVKKTEPGYFWSKDGKRFARQLFQKHKLVAQGFDASKTEDQIMLERGYVKIYNSGNLLYKI